MCSNFCCKLFLNQNNAEKQFAIRSWCSQTKNIADQKQSDATRAEMIVDDVP